MTIIKCKYCGGSVTLSGGTHGICDYCGQELTFPVNQENRVLAMYDRANHFRTLGEFDRAYSAYQHLVAENNQDPELHWNLVLCRYGVEYVLDERLSSTELGIQEYKPTISRMSFDPILDDIDYKAAITYADETGRRIYKREAGKLAQIQNQYLEIVREEIPYDVFISFKAENSDGSRTKASELGQEIYEQLTGKGLKVFFSRITLEDKLSEQYEPYIFAALRSAKVMLLMADNREQVETRWVKNEWSRFLLMAESDKSKSIIPVFNSKAPGNMNPYEFPDKIPTTQAQDMAKLGAMQDLVRGVCKLTGHIDGTKAMIMKGGITLENLLRRAFHALEDGEFQEAKQFADKVLDMDPENAQALLYYFLAEKNVVTLFDLDTVDINWQKDKQYARVKQFGNDRIKAELAHFEEKCRKDTIISHAKAALEREDFAKAIKLLQDLPNDADAIRLAEQCEREQTHKYKLKEYYEEIGKKETYLNRKFQERYSNEYYTWENLKDMCERGEMAEGQKLTLVAIIAAVVFSVYAVFKYNHDRDFVAVYLIWDVLIGLQFWLHGERDDSMWTIVGWAAGCFFLRQIADMFYAEDMVNNPIMGWLMLAISLLLLMIRWKDGIADFLGNSYIKKEKNYYQNTILPIEQKLRAEVEEKWKPEIGEENLLDLNGISI